MPSGPAALAVLVAADTCLLTAAGVFNPSFATYRMSVTDDRLMVRVVTAWSVGAKTAQPLGMALGGAVAALAGVRVAVLLAGVLCLASTLLLPWRAFRSPDAAGGAGHEQSAADSVSP
ncbi:hypothetical protein [Streptomyces sp. MI02-7b]|uniref:hypothetical protein n=1 Tax=Streptomyces sp. MI02-7b TaxID=462941 RepID=UPI0029CA4254|nr:hypothetical protein [Streptomyces sp. MI02-7b]